jgi:hypothetical protein
MRPAPAVARPRPRGCRKSARRLIAPPLNPMCIPPRPQTTRASTSAPEDNSRAGSSRSSRPPRMARGCVLHWSRWWSRAEHSSRRSSRALDTAVGLLDFLTRSPSPRCHAPRRADPRVLTRSAATTLRHGVTRTSRTPVAQGLRRPARARHKPVTAIVRRRSTLPRARAHPPRRRCPPSPAPLRRVLLSPRGARPRPRSTATDSTGAPAAALMSRTPLRGSNACVTAARSPRACARRPSTAPARGTQRQRARARRTIERGTGRSCRSDPR